MDSQDTIWFITKEDFYYNPLFCDSHHFISIIKRWVTQSEKISEVQWLWNTLCGQSINVSRLGTVKRVETWLKTHGRFWWRHRKWDESRRFRWHFKHNHFTSDQRSGSSLTRKGEHWTENFICQPRPRSRVQEMMLDCLQKSTWWAVWMNWRIWNVSTSAHLL